ncbi:unnamed protein product [Protopolystoma xenopodis]|uniref:Uncharacterized protein n=1 Tax=Protopolystoma xenopodis TaxID=117903 RepID=A0A3S5B4V0_9PLAT|nr:unnamed protein product [Protopolystoma xenopodis]
MQRKEAVKSPASSGYCCSGFCLNLQTYSYLSLSFFCCTLLPCRIGHGSEKSFFIIKFNLAACSAEPQLDRNILPCSQAAASAGMRADIEANDKRLAQNVIFNKITPPKRSAYLVKGLSSLEGIFILLMLTSHVSGSVFVREDRSNHSSERVSVKSHELAQQDILLAPAFSQLKAYPKNMRTL